MQPIVTDRVAWSVCRSVTIVSPAKTAEPIEMWFGMQTQLGQRNHMLDRGPDTPAKVQFWGGRACHELCKNGWKNQDAVWIVDSRGPKKHALDGVQIPPPNTNGQFGRERGRPIVKYKDSRPWAVEKQLNRSTCRLGWDLGVQWSMY